MGNIKLHEGQSLVYKDIFINKYNRFFVVCCSRGWGKSYMACASAMTSIFELMELDSWVPNKNVYIIAPTYDQVKDIYYPIIQYDFGAENIALKSSRDLGRFQFPKNVELRLVSYESIERMRGKGAYFVVGDEISSWKHNISPKEAWESIIQPCITTRWSNKHAKAYNSRSPGRALFISTPKGYNFFYESYNYQDIDKLWKSYHFDYTSSPFLDTNEIERIKHTIDPIEFASEYLATFTDSGMNVFYCFDRKKHISNDLKPFDKGNDEQKGEDVHVAIDFNVGIMASAIFAIRGKQMQFIDEMKGHPDTETLAKQLVEKYKGHRIYAYPDPTGRSRKTSAAVGRTDFSILTSFGINVLSRPVSPPVVDSVAAVNKKLLTASGDVDMYFHPKCTETIKSIERTQWLDKNPELATIDKTQNIEHFSDAIRYATEYLFPVLSGVKPISRGFQF